MKTKVTREQLEMYCDYAETFGTDAGKRVLADLKASFDGECHVPGDHYETLHNSSLRDFTIRIEEMIERASTSEIEED